MAISKFWSQDFGKKGMGGGYLSTNLFGHYSMTIGSTQSPVGKTKKKLNKHAFEIYFRQK